MTTKFDPATGLKVGTFGVGTYQTAHSAPFPGLVLPDGAVIDLSARYRDTLAIFEDWDRAFDSMVAIADARNSPEVRWEDVTKLPVVARPNLLCTGANYRQHVAEMMTYNAVYQHLRHDGESDESFFARNLDAVDRRSREGMPYIWPGMHSALAGADDDIMLPVVGEDADWELELGFFITGTGRNLDVEDAGALIAAYVMVDDLGLIDQARRTDVQFQFDWLSKSSPGFFPCGPFAVPKEFVDLAESRITLKVNGETKQDWPVDDMIFSCEQLISYASERVRLTAGDLFIAGSPPGNGARSGGRFLQEGDVVDAEITHLGRQRNRVVVENAHGRVPTFGPFPTGGTYGV